MARSRRPAELLVAGRTVRVEFVRKRRARRYILRMRPDGSARVTIPPGGSQAGALAFAAQHGGWMERQLLKPRPAAAAPWGIGTEIWFRGERWPLRSGERPDEIAFANHSVRVRSGTGCCRAEIEWELRRLATGELVARTVELARLHEIAIARVSVRDQRSRWGSCSATGTISLNWRLIQTPPPVRDYIILHELMHRLEMNHSPRYWERVAAVCPEYPAAEAWLKEHRELLR